MQWTSGYDATNVVPHRIETSAEYDDSRPDDLQKTNNGSKGWNCGCCCCAPLGRHTTAAAMMIHCSLSPWATDSSWGRPNRAVRLRCSHGRSICSLACLFVWTRSSSTTSASFSKERSGVDRSLFTAMYTSIIRYCTYASVRWTCWPCVHFNAPDSRPPQTAVKRSVLLGEAAVQTVAPSSPGERSGAPLGREPRGTTAVESLTPHLTKNHRHLIHFASVMLPMVFLFSYAFKHA